MPVPTFVYTIGFHDSRSIPGTCRPISPDGYFIQPMISPSADAVVFWGRLDDEAGFNIWRRDLAANQLRKLTDDRAVSGHPFWSADGNRIVYTSTLGASDAIGWEMSRQFELGRPSTNLWIMDRDGGNRRRVTEGPFVDERPCFSPDGRSVVFVSNRSGHMNLWSVDVESGRLAQVNIHDGLDYRPVFSPDGTRLAFFTNNNPRGVRDLCIMDWTTKAKRFPVPEGYFNWIHGPFWLADAKTLMIHGSAANGDPISLYLFHLDDRTIRKVRLEGIRSYAHGTLNAAGTILAFDSVDRPPANP